MRVRNLTLTWLALCVGCSLTTDAGDRELIERLDFDYQFSDMTPHVESQLDVALVSNVEGARSLVGRARILLPPRVEGVPYPTQHLQMSRLVGPGKHEVLFYIDNDLNNDPAPEENGARPEHIWVRTLAANGEGSFQHLFVFQDFKEDYTKNTDFVLDIPPIAAGSQRETCLNMLFDLRVKDSLEVRVVFDPNGARLQSGYFAMYKGNKLPTRPVRLEGIADQGAPFGIEVLVDGVRARDPFPAQPTAQGATIAFEAWFPAQAGEIQRCLTLP